MEKIFRCGECRWRCGRTSSVGIECLQPENKQKWDAAEEKRTRAGRRYTQVVARFKPKSARACKRFERKTEE